MIGLCRGCLTTKPTPSVGIAALARELRRQSATISDVPLTLGRMVLLKLNAEAETGPHIIGPPKSVRRCQVGRNFSSAGKVAAS